ncbi:hypothetical protein JCM16303_001712 [Sporobolomyces ruberrimus]
MAYYKFEGNLDGDIRKFNLRKSPPLLFTDFAQLIDDVYDLASGYSTRSFSFTDDVSNLESHVSRQEEFEVFVVSLRNEATVFPKKIDLVVTHREIPSGEKEELFEEVRAAVKADHSLAGDLRKLLDEIVGPVPGFNGPPPHSHHERGRGGHERGRGRGRGGPDRGRARGDGHHHHPPPPPPHGPHGGSPGHEHDKPEGRDPHRDPREHPPPFPPHMPHFPHHHHGPPLSPPPPPHMCHSPYPPPTWTIERTIREYWSPSFAPFHPAPPPPPPPSRHEAPHSQSTQATEELIEGENRVQDEEWRSQFNDHCA